MFSFSHKLLVILEIVTLLWNKYIVMNSLIQAGLQGTSSERADCEAEATAAACALALPLWAFRPAASLPSPQQFQSFSQYRCKTAKKSEEEIDFLRSNPKIWNVHSVLNVLHSLVDKSNINRQLEVYTSGGECRVLSAARHLVLRHSGRG